MNTKERCLDCGEKLKNETHIIKNKDGQHFCSNWCKDNWKMDIE